MKVKMKKILYSLRKYPFSVSCILCIWLLCLAPVPETPLNSINMIDKWTHVVMFGGLTFTIWAEYGREHITSDSQTDGRKPSCHNETAQQSRARQPHYNTIDKAKLLLWGFIAPIMMGGAIEIAQSTCTGGNRSGDFIDFIADAIGVCIGALTGIPLALMLSKRNRDSVAD